MRILVVDDSEDWRDITEAALMAAGYDEVATAESAAGTRYAMLGVGARAGNGAPAADLDRARHHDAGDRRHRGLRAHPQRPALRRHADDHGHRRSTTWTRSSNAFVAGATDYITKPFNRVELLARVRSALKIKAELERRKARERELTALIRSTWGDRDAGRWIDETTGLFVGDGRRGLSRRRCRAPARTAGVGARARASTGSTRSRAARGDGRARDAVLAQVAQRVRRDRRADRRDRRELSATA